MTLHTRPNGHGARTKLVAAAATTLGMFSLAACGAEERASAEGDGPIKVGSIYDLSGPLSVIGTPKDDATKLAIKHINDNGGVLGRNLELISFDAQSDNAKYTQYANTLLRQEQVAVIDAGVTSASREAIRPLVGQTQTPYFYGNLYEGGVCDKNVFATGSVPSQQLAQLVPYAIENFGNKFAIAAADYNFGHDEAAWAEKYIEENGGEVVSTEFLPLEQNDFGSTLNNLQAKRPDVFVSLLVGGDQMSFYKQFAAAGLNDDIEVITPVFGDGQEQLAVGKEATDGVVIAYSYLQELDTPANKEFLDLWREEYGPDYPYITPSAVAVWNDWHLWAAAVEQAGSLSRDEVIEALESNISFDGPGGKITIDPGSHHAIQDVHVARGTAEGTFEVLKTYPQVEPSFEQSVCDLVANPETDEQFKP